jgi:hypothetical protein
LVDVAWWQSSGSNSPIENFLLHRKIAPFFRRIWIGPHAAELIDDVSLRLRGYPSSISEGF